MATSLTQNFSKEEFKKNVISNCKSLYRKNIEEANQQEVFQAVSYAVKDIIIDKWIATHKQYEKDDPKMVYYMSMEFLMGRALGNNMINLCAYDEIKEALDELGLDINVIEDQEPDAALRLQHGCQTSISQPSLTCVPLVLWVTKELTIMRLHFVQSTQLIS